MAGSIGKVQAIRLAVFRGVTHRDGMRLDRDAAFPFQIHRIEQLILAFAILDRAGPLEQTIGERRLAVIDMRDDAEIARELDGHEAVHYAGAPQAGQCGRGVTALLAAVSTDIRQTMRSLTVVTHAGSVPHELHDAVISIGRASENAIVIPDPSVSGRHAQLIAVGEDYQLTDLDSTNGTRVNGENVRTVLLQAGDRILFGKVQACFECEAAETAQPLPVPEDVAAQPAEVSVRPADFGNASPFQKRNSPKDPARVALYAAVAVALLVFVASMLALAQMRAPLP